VKRLAFPRARIEENVRRSVVPGGEQGHARTVRALDDVGEGQRLTVFAQHHAFDMTQGFGRTAEGGRGDRCETLAQLTACVAHGGAVQIRAARGGRSGGVRNLVRSRGHDANLIEPDT
jgi:hypothetical protein